MRTVGMLLAIALVPAVRADESVPQLKFLGTLEGVRPGPYSRIAFSPDGKLLAVGDYKPARIEEGKGTEHPDHSLVQLWDVDKRQVIATLRGHTEAVVGVVFSGDGKTLVSMTDGSREIKLWDVATVKEKAPRKRDPWWTSFLALSRDGKTIASVSDDNGAIILWEPSTGKEKASLKGHPQSVLSATFSPDGKLFAAGGGRFGSEGLAGAGEVKLWDVATGRERVSLKGAVKLKITSHQLSYLHKAEGVPKRVLLKIAALNGMAFQTEDVDGELTKAIEKVLDREQRDKYLKVVRREIGTTSHEGPEVVWSVAFSPDGKMLASGSLYGSVLLWDVKSGKRMATLQRFNSQGKRPPNPTYSVAFSPDGKLLAAGTLHGIKLWDVQSNENVVPLSDPAGTVWSVAFRPDGKTLASAGSKGIIGPRDSREGNPILRLWALIPATKKAR